MEQNQQIQNGDIYLNPVFGDLWLAKRNQYGQPYFVKINNGYSLSDSEATLFIKVGHVDIEAALANQEQ